MKIFHIVSDSGHKSPQFSDSQADSRAGEFN